MADCAVKRVGGNVVAVMRGNFTLQPGYVLEVDVGQEPPVTPPGPKRVMDLKLVNALGAFPAGTMLKVEVQ